MNKYVKTKDLFNCETPYLKSLFENCEYPWEMLPKIKQYILDLIKNGIDGYTELEEKVRQTVNVCYAEID